VILTEIPLRPDDQFAWSVDVHNAVNVKLGKPVLTIEQAKAELTLPALGNATAIPFHRSSEQAAGPGLQ
jgi:hypothetical protein